MEKLISTDTQSFASYFKVTDLNNDVVLSEPYNYFLIDTFDECEIETILPQVYTGSEITPEINILYRGSLVFDEDEYKVEYSNNVEKGTATVKVTSLVDDIPGTITAAFTICDLADAAEETVKLLPDDHTADKCGDAEEHYDHIRIIEQAVRYFESGSKLSNASRTKLKTQYLALLDLIGSELSNPEIWDETGDNPDTGAAPVFAVIAAAAAGMLISAKRRKQH